MRIIDYLFYCYYCYFERRNKRHPNLFWGDSRVYSLCVMYFSVAIPLGVCYALINIFVTPLPALPQYDTIQGKFIGLILGILFIGPLIYRYYHNKKITKNKFQLFRERWGEDPRTNKKGRIAVIIYTICTTVLPWFGPIILHFIYK